MNGKSPTGRFSIGKLSMALVALNMAAAFAQEGGGSSECSEATRFWAAKNGDSRGLVIVAHGLNVRPSKMGDDKTDGTLVKLFLDNEFDVLRVTLKGHGLSLDDMKTATVADWRNDAASAYREATLKANGKPVYLCGFSLGALAFEELMSRDADVVFKKTALFSPAIAIKKSARAVLLIPFARDETIIGSASPAEYRAQKGASIGAYKALFALEESLVANRFKNNNSAAIIFIDPFDELISAKILQNRIHQFNLSAWKIVQVSNHGAAIHPSYHHLIIDDHCVSPQTWSVITQTLLAFFNEE